MQNEIIVLFKTTNSFIFNVKILSIKYICPSAQFNDFFTSVLRKPKMGTSLHNLCAKFDVKIPTSSQTLHKDRE